MRGDMICTDGRGTRDYSRNGWSLVVRNAISATIYRQGERGEYWGLANEGQRIDALTAAIHKFFRKDPT